MSKEDTKGLVFDSKRAPGSVLVKNSDNEGLGMIIKYGPKAGNGLAGQYRYLSFDPQQKFQDIAGKDYPSVKTKVIEKLGAQSCPG